MINEGFFASPPSFTARLDVGLEEEMKLTDEELS